MHGHPLVARVRRDLGQIGFGQRWASGGKKPIPVAFRRPRQVRAHGPQLVERFAVGPADLGRRFGLGQGEFVLQLATVLFGGVDDFGPGVAQLPVRADDEELFLDAEGQHCAPARRRDGCQGGIPGRRIGQTGQAC